MFARGIHFMGALTLVVALVAGGSPVKAQSTILNYGESVTGQITAETYYELWQFVGTQGDQVRITMTGSGDLDPYLGLIEMTSEEVVAEDDDSAGTPNAMIEATLPTSDIYLIIATRYGFDTGVSVGEYTLTLDSTSDTSPVVVDTNPDQNQPNQGQIVFEGVYDMGSIDVNDSASNVITDNSFAHLYNLYVSAPVELTMLMSADGSSLDSYLAIMDDSYTNIAEDDNSGASMGGGALDAFVQASLSSGHYTITAGRAAGPGGNTEGAYVLTLSAPDDSDGGPDDSDAVTVPGMILAGDITAGTSAIAVIDDTNYMYLYRFAGSANEVITVTMASEMTLDPYVGIMDANSNVLAEDDDSGGGVLGLDAQVSVMLPETGGYIIVATRAGFDTGLTTGGFTLTVTSDQPTTSDGNDLSGVSNALSNHRAFSLGDSTFYLQGLGATRDPAKIAPLQTFLNQ